MIKLQSLSSEIANSAVIGTDMIKDTQRNETLNRQFWNNWQEITARRQKRKREILSLFE